VRVALLAMILAALVFGWFAVRWQLGNMLAELTVSTDPNAKDIGQLAQSLAPGDPLATWLVASTEKDVFTPEKIESSLAKYEETVRLSPYDYRWWVELGRAREQSTTPELAEAAYLRAVELAPTYTYPHWQLGNFYLRQNRSEEAFTELKKAAQNNLRFRQQVYSIAWDFYEQDKARLEAIAGEFSDAKVGLAQFYASKGMAEDSLRIWNTLSEEEKKQNDVIAKLVAQILWDNKRFRSAVEFVRETGIEPEAKAEAVQNGGFEAAIGKPEATYFGWKISPVEKMTVQLDASQKREGRRSLRVNFSGFSAPQLNNIFQIAAVEPGANYRLRFWLKTEDLKSAGPPVVEILDSKDSRLLAASKPFPTGTNDWQEVTIDFTAAEEAEGIFIRTARAYCGDVCPIIGTIWYDDFRLEKR
jgi:Flp pilus assembly protein TadD